MNTIFIKNMVCDRCIMVVQNELEKLGLDAKNIKLGEVILSKEITSLEKENLSKTLEPLGFEVIDDKKGRIIEKIKNIIEPLYEHYLYHIEELPVYNQKMINSEEDKEQAVCDYIAGMTDHFAIEQYTEIFIPKFFMQK